MPRADATIINATDWILLAGTDRRTPSGNRAPLRRRSRGKERSSTSTVTRESDLNQVGECFPRTRGWAEIQGWTGAFKARKVRGCWRSLKVLFKRLMFNCRAREGRESFKQETEVFRSVTTLDLSLGVMKNKSDSSCIWRPFTPFMGLQNALGWRQNSTCSFRLPRVLPQQYVHTAGQLSVFTTVSH